MLCVFDHVMNQFPKEFRMKYKDQCLLKESHFQLMHIGYILKNTIKTIVQICSDLDHRTFLRGSLGSHRRCNHSPTHGDGMNLPMSDVLNECFWLLLAIGAI